MLTLPVNVKAFFLFVCQPLIEKIRTKNAQYPNSTCVRCVDCVTPPMVHTGASVTHASKLTGPDQSQRAPKGSGTSEATRVTPSVSFSRRDTDPDRGPVSDHASSDKV